MRTSLHLCILIVLLAATGSCDDRARGQAPITLRFWNGFTGPDGRTMLALVKRFNQANPDVHVIMQRMEWGTYYNKLFVANLGHRGPDVFILHSEHVLRFTRAGFVRPMDDLTRGDIPAADLDAIAYNKTLFDGKHWAVPLDMHLLGLYYNKQLFREVGIDHPPTNRAEFLNAARKLTRDTNGDGRIDQWGFVFDWLRPDGYSLLAQNGGDVFNADRTVCTLDSPQNVEALQFAADLIAKERVTPSPQDMGGRIGFRQGRVGMVFGGIFNLPEYQRQKQQAGLDFGAAPLPTLLTKPAAWCSSHNMCIRSDAADRALDAAKRFVKFLSDNSLDWAAGGQIPVRKSLRNSDRFRAMEAQSQFAKQIEHGAYYPSVMFVNEYLTYLDQAVERTLRGSMSPQEALSISRKNIDAVMQRYNTAGKP